MTYYIHPFWFYIIGTCNWIKYPTIMAGIGITILFIFFWYAASIDLENYIQKNCKRYGEDNENKEWYIKGFADLTQFIKRYKRIAIVGVVITVCGLLLPTKTTCVEMLVASKVTHENVQIAKEEIYNIIDYIDERFNGEQTKEDEGE